MPRKTRSTTTMADAPDIASAAPASTAIGATAKDAASGADAPAPGRNTKSATIVALLARPEGATLAELIAATGWLPHTTRAALTGLKKKGHVIERGKRDDATCYRIVAA